MKYPALPRLIHQLNRMVNQWGGGALTNCNALERHGLDLCLYVGVCVCGWVCLCVCVGVSEACASITFILSTGPTLER